MSTQPKASARAGQEMASLVRAGGKYETFGEIIEREGATSGFDYLRVLLSVSVVLVHSFRIVNGPEFIGEDTPVLVRGLINLILPMFFALSGFLVTASLFRLNNLPVFLTFRALRIFPALMVEVALSALILGAVMTTLPVSEYFTAEGFRVYFTNMLGIVNFHLPGVFENNPTTEVNGSLWTVPFELECYIALAILSLLTIVRRRFLILAVIVLFSAFICFTTAFDHGDGLLDFTQRTMVQDDIHISRLLVISFLAGVVMYVFRDRLPATPYVAGGALALAIILLSMPLLYGFAVLPAAYATVWLGLLTPPKNRLLRSGDYSYGIYLYAYPIQQTVWSMGGAGQNVAGNLVISLIAVSLFAAFSWHCIEKPSLGLKNRLFKRSKSPAAAPAGRS